MGVLSLLLVAGSALLASAQPPSTLYVDCAVGSDTNSGNATAPFASPRHARDVIRALQPLAAGISVLIRGDCFGVGAGGRRNYSEPVLALDSPLDSGASEAQPIRYAVWPGFRARFLGGAPVPAAAWTAAAPPAPAGAVTASLAALGLGAYSIGDLVGDLGSLGECTWGRSQLFAFGAGQPLARWPNPLPNGTVSWARTEAVTNGGKAFTIHVSPARLAGWLAAPELLGLGWWSIDWAWNAVHMSVAAGAASTATLTEAPGDAFWGGVLAGSRFQVANVLAELDVAGEYYIERASGEITFLPPAPLSAPDADVFLSFADAVVVAGVDPATLAGLGTRSADGSYALRNNNDLLQRNTIVGAAVQVGDPAAAVLRHVVLEGITIAYARGSGVVAGGVDDFRLTDCDMSHHGRNGALLVGTRIAVVRATVADVGCAGILLYGGDDLALTRAGSSIVDSAIANFSTFVRSYTPGIGWAGVGFDIRNVSLVHAPHSAVMGSGNDAHFDGLTIRDVAWEVSDSGSFYSGYSWVKRGNSVTNSKFVDLVNIERIYLGYPSIQGVR